MSSTIFRTLVLAGLTALVSGHAVMNVPEPYGFGTGLTNGPMTRANFPCKKNEVSFVGGNKTTWSNGQAQPLHLLSGATHGGGSCFIAMTYETPGSSAFMDASNWRNVYSIPGQCPATTAGNLEGNMQTVGGYPTGPQCSSPNSDQTDCVHSYTIAMPDELKDGDATFGWVWLSHLTTETYMNCAPITISGAKNNGKFDSLPSLQGMSFTGLTGGGVPGGSGSSSSSSSSSSGSASAGSSSSPASAGSTSGSVSSGSAASSSAAAATPAASSAASSTSNAGGSNAAGGGASVSSPPPPAPATAVPDTSGGACTSGAIKCTSASWSMCSNGAWVDMGSVGGLTCTNDTLNKLRRFRFFKG